MYAKAKNENTIKNPNSLSHYIIYSLAKNLPEQNSWNEGF